MRFQVAAAAVVIPAATLIASAGSVLVETFDLYNHPDGIADPSAYGLRLDSWSGTSDNPVSFSFEDGLGGSNVQLQVFDTGGGLEININGVVWGNSATGGTDYGTFMLDLTYSVAAVPGGYESGTVEVIGSLTELVDTVGDDDGQVFDLTSILNMSNNTVFQFLADGHRLDNDNSTWVGRGWLSETGSGGGTNDLLFTAEIVPLPPAAVAGLGLLAGLGAYRRMRS